MIDVLIREQGVDDGEKPDGLCLPGVWRSVPKVGGALFGLRGMEQYGGGTGGQAFSFGAG